MPPSQDDYLQKFGDLDKIVQDKKRDAFILETGEVQHQPANSPSWAATQIERWRLVRPLGRGGQGSVHLEEISYRSSIFSSSLPTLRAVKVIAEEESGVRTLQHLPEILSMAQFSKVRITTLVATPKLADGFQLHALIHRIVLVVPTRLYGVHCNGICAIR